MTFELPSLSSDESNKQTDSRPSVSAVSPVCPLELDDPAQCNALVDPSTGRQMCRSQGACNHDECYAGDKCCGVHDEDTCTARGSCDWNPYCELIIGEGNPMEQGYETGEQRRIGHEHMAALTT